MALMSRSIQIGLLSMLLTGGAWAAEDPKPTLLMPVFSFEAYEVNGIPVPNGPASKITVGPGDVIIAKIRLRNWSPEGQKLRGYQVKVDPAGYKSGEAGTVMPLGHEPGKFNDANAFIETKDPNFIHFGIESIPIVDTSSEGYRWLNVIMDPDKSPASAQDSKKHNCGTVRLVASEDARGTFTLNFTDEGGASGLLDPFQAPIVPMGFEPMQVEVREGARWLKIVSSDPPNGAVDARLLPGSPGKGDQGWKTVLLELNAEVSKATPDDFLVHDGGASPPRIASVEVNGAHVLITLDKPVARGMWTTIRHKSSQSLTRLGRLPGDVNNDGKLNADDLMALIQGLNGGTNLPLYRTDLNGDGSFGTRDVMTLIEELANKRSRKENRLRE